ncbi:MAG: hypothetical protein IKD26_04955 [Clostridia bacterium]|nr:hypothetical protein [Clostridia bacterium]
MKLKEKANLALGLAIVMILVVIIGAVCAIGVAKCWFGHEYGEDGICAKCGAEKPVEEPPAEEPDEDGGLEIDPEAQARGMRLASVRIPRPQFAEEGISPLAESAIQITATVTPADAIDQEVDWTIEWNNASSTWAKGKNVTDYVTVTPTSDGALTANVACLQAFAEKVIVTVRLRSNTAFYATANVDYEKRILGFDLSTVSDKLTWTMTTSNLNPVVNFPMMTSNSNTEFSEDWGYWLGDPARMNITVTPRYSIYTLDKNFGNLQISVASSSQYINALKAAGFNVEKAAGEFVVLENVAFGTAVSFTYDELMFATAEGSLDTYQEYVSLRSAIRNSVSSTMLQIKIQAGTDERDAVTIYNLKFSADSVTPVVENIVVNPGSIKF